MGAVRRVARLPCAQVRLSPLVCQIHLALALGQRALLFGRARAMAIGAAHAPHIVGRRKLSFAQWHAARPAQLVVAWCQAVAHGHPLVKHKTVALPAAVLLRHGFQVLEDAAFEVKYLFKTL